MPCRQADVFACWSTRQLLWGSKRVDRSIVDTRRQSCSVIGSDLVNRDGMSVSTAGVMMAVVRHFGCQHRWRTVRRFGN